ncbi:MAG: hypothetical protein ACOVOQ_06680, partial [Flavobacterium sp.]
MRYFVAFFKYKYIISNNYQLQLKKPRQLSLGIQSFHSIPHHNSVFEFVDEVDVFVVVVFLFL